MRRYRFPLCESRPLDAKEGENAIFLRKIHFRGSRGGEKPFPHSQLTTCFARGRGIRLREQVSCDIPTLPISPFLSALGLGDFFSSAARPVCLPPFCPGGTWEEVDPTFPPLLPPTSTVAAYIAAAKRRGGERGKRPKEEEN